MAITQISAGSPTLLSQNVVYALPMSGVHRLTCDDATVTFSVSNDQAYGSSASATLSGGGFDSAFAYIKATNKDATICCRKWNA